MHYIALSHFRFNTGDDTWFKKKKRKKLNFFQVSNAPTLILQTSVKHDRIAKEFSCGVNSLPLSFADLTGRGLDLQEKGERQKKERGGGVQKGGLMVSVEGWGGL